VESISFSRIANAKRSELPVKFLFHDTADKAGDFNADSELARLREYHSNGPEEGIL
jgi:hypothetical protein